jgi:hypothetical protein
MRQGSANGVCLPRVGDIRHICPRRFFGMPMQTNYIDLKSLAAARIWSVVQVVTITPGEGLHQ